MSKFATPQTGLPGRIEYLVGALLCGVLLLPVYLGLHPAVSLAVAAVPLGLAVVLRFPVVVVVAFVAFSFFRLHDVLPVLNNARLPLALGAGALAALVWHVFLGRTVSPRWYPPLVWMLILFLVVAAVSVLSLDRGNSVGLLLNGFIKVVGASLALAWLISTRAQLRFAMMAMIGLGSVVALKALYNKVAGIDLVEGTRVTIGRTIGSPLGDPNDLALVLLFPLCIALAFMLFGKGGWARVFSALGVVVILAGIVATQSRGGLLGVLAVCFVLGQYYIRSKAVTIAGVVIAALGLVAMMGLSERQSGGFDTYSEAVELDQSASDRLVAWMAGVNMAVSHPLSGVGMGNFTTFYYAYTPEWKGRPHAHPSAWFNPFGETGTPGFIVFIGFEFRHHRAVRRRDGAVLRRPR